MKCGAGTGLDNYLSGGQLDPGQSPDVDTNKPPKCL